jgi:FrmR/RcnR family transcriptional regulator, repressor of frmRAB operon
MAHTIHDKKKLLLRVRRIRGQVEALEKLLGSEAGCSEALHLTVACRGAMNSLMAELLEGHVRHHVLDDRVKGTSAQAQAAEEVIDAVRTYLR